MSWIILTTIYCLIALIFISNKEAQEEFNTNDEDNFIILVAIIWPISLPCAVINKFISWLFRK